MAATDPAGDGGADADSSDGAGAAVTPSTPTGGSGRSPRPSPGRPDTGIGAADGTCPDPHWFDTGALDGLLGVGSLNLGPADAAWISPPDEVAAALPGRDQTSPPSPMLLALSVLILLGVAGVVAHRCWWDRRPGRYWPA